jgi:hypothetical protein
MNKPTPGQPRRRHDRLADTGPAVEDHGRVVTTSRRAAGFYRQAQRAIDARRATAALRLAVNADPAFGLAIADLDAITATAGEASGRQQMSWERHHIEVVRTAAAGNAQRAADLLREQLASVGCDPLAVRIAAQLRPPDGPDDDFEDLVGRLPACHATPWPSSP